MTIYLPVFRLDETTQCRKVGCGIFDWMFYRLYQRVWIVSKWKVVSKDWEVMAQNTTKLQAILDYLKGGLR